MTMGFGRHRHGVLRVKEPGVLLIWCDACQAGHEIDIHKCNRDGRLMGWDGDHIKPTIAEPVRVEPLPGLVCEFLLRAGVMYYLQSCTHAMRGKSAHLRDYPIPG